MKSAIGLVLLFVALSYAEEYAMDDGTPDRHPYVQCKIELYDCIRLDKKDNMACLADYKTCMSVLVPSVPPTLTKCNNELKTCLAASSGIWAKAKCFASYGKCLVPTEHPYFKCKIDLGKCLKDGTKGKLECMRDYKNCMAQLLPTVPPFVAACNEEFSTCLSIAVGFKEVSQCSVDYGKCIKNGVGSS